MKIISRQQVVDNWRCAYERVHPQDRVPDVVVEPQHYRVGRTLYWRSNLIAMTREWNSMADTREVQEASVPPPAT